MIDPKIFDDVVQKLTDACPPVVRDIKEDLERNFKSILQSAFSKLDLVTREEFDVQAGVLARTRAKLETLERKVTALEKELSGKHGHKGHS